jgi:hypothetical protein
MVRVKRELLLFALLFLFLSIAMHFGAWVDHPMAHIASLEKSPLGLWHPLFITVLVYLVLLIIRFLFSFMKKLIA